MDYINTIYNRGGLWSSGSWYISDQGNGTLSVILYGRERDQEFSATRETIDSEIEKLEPAAFAGEEDLIWYALNKILREA